MRCRKEKGTESQPTHAYQMKPAFSEKNIQGRISDFLCFETEKIKKVSVPFLIKESQVKTVDFGWILVLRTSQLTLISKTGT